MGTLLLLIALAQTDGGCLRDREGRILSSGLPGLGTMNRFNDALAAGACDQAQQELTDALRCASPPKSVIDSLRSRIELCRSKAIDAGKP